MARPPRIAIPHVAHHVIQRGNRRLPVFFTDAGRPTRNNSSYVWTGGVNVSRNYTVNGLNQYLSAGPATFTHDANGNLTSDGTSSYVYDAENRLVSSSASGGTTLSYDPLGRLWKIWSQQTGTTSFLHDGDHVVAEYDWTGAMLRRYFWGPGADEPIIQDEGSALNCTGTRFLHPNHQGSVIAASNCSGQIAAVNRYDEYGIPQATWGRFQYTGQAWLGEIGMYYYKARIYSPTLGRFLQTDPIGYGDGMNMYAYVGNDPINGIDPSGLNVLRHGGAPVIPDCPPGWQCSDNTPIRPGSIPYSAIVSVLQGRYEGGGPVTFQQPAPQSKQCYGAPGAPGTGSTQNELAALAQKNAAEAASRRWNPLNLFWFRSQVKNKGPWDYKQFNRGYQDFGNYNYGRTGAAMGLVTGFLLGQAGRAQQAAGTSKPEWGSPGFLGIGDLGGTGSYGDDPRDQEMIKRGISDQRNEC